MIIFFYGEDSFRSRRKLLEIKQKYLNSDKSGSGLSVFDCALEKNVAEKIIDIFSIPNLLAPKRLLVVEDLISAGAKEDQDKIQDFLAKDRKRLAEDGDAVAVFWESENIKKNNSLYKELIKNFKSQSFDKLTGAKLSQWAVRTMKEIDVNAQISRHALNKLLAFCGEDTFLVFFELQKLINYADGKIIEEADVELLVKANLNSNIFNMVDAIGANNKQEALDLLHRHLAKGDDPFYLMSMFFYQFRNMLRVADLYEKGIRSDYEISRMTKLHPFVVKKSLAQSAKLSFEKLQIIYAKLAKLDTDVKTGKIGIRLGLDKFVAEI